MIGKILPVLTIWSLGTAHSNIRFEPSSLSNYNSPGRFEDRAYHHGRYVVRDNGSGCGTLTVSENECKKAAKILGFDSSMGYEKLDSGHLPNGCFVGHAHTGWKYTYFNVNKGIANIGFKSICRRSHAAPDCNILPQSMNGPAFKKGCSGAVWANGSPSENYCKNRDGRFPWWGACCGWNGHARMCVPKKGFNGKKRRWWKH